MCCAPELKEVNARSATAIAAEPLCPPAEARIVVVPGATPVTTPTVDTCAIEALSVVQFTACETTFPFTSLTVAVRGTVPPTATVAPETLTEATAGGGDGGGGGGGAVVPLPPQAEISSIVPSREMGPLHVGRRRRCGTGELEQEDANRVIPSVPIGETR
jgi:hypothetical protein